MKIIILDGYVDEPSCLGIPPYISPYVRYTAGAISDAGHDPIYITIDEYRRGSPKLKSFSKTNLLVVIGGAIVPGKYLRGYPASISETKRIAENFKGTKILGGPLAKFGLSGGKTAKKLDGIFDFISKKDVDAFVYDLLLRKSPEDRLRNKNEWNKWAISGSQIILQHPDFPMPLIVELESYRGCVRYHMGGCAFCIEPLFGEPQFRDAKDIISEVGALNKEGAVNFRLGAQSCIFSYGSKGVGESETPKPNPPLIESLFVGIRKSAPNLEVLHTDNANPAVISEHPMEAKAIIKTLIKYCTSGNVLALGMESADPQVIKANSLNANPAQVKSAIELINEYGRKQGDTGMPKLLPGLNILCGLSGETKKTYEYNFQFLKDILESDLLLRRINIRQVSFVRKRFDVKTNHSDFLRFKKKVREEIDHKMLKKVIPPKTILHDVFMEKREGNISFGRQVGTYPILVGVPYPISEGRILNVIITDYGQRSVTGVEYPLDVNKASLKALTGLPKIGKKRAAQIVRKRPFSSIQELLSALDSEEVASDLADFISF